VVKIVEMDEKVALNAQLVGDKGGADILLNKSTVSAGYVDQY
jgi:hypothetical protein